MNNLDAIYARLKENEEITKKFHSVESKILSILNFKDFMEELLNAIQTTFSIPYVWLSLVENSIVHELIVDKGPSDTLKENSNFISEDIFLDLIGNKVKPILENKDLKPYYKLFPNNQKFFIKSIAIAPITLDGKIIGSLNQGDADQYRFKPGIDTTLLEQLAIKVSLCLSNVTAHEKLKYFAYRDPLTELLNRRVMEKVLKREFSRSNRYAKELSLVFMDIDGFKQINDSYGHDKGDDILKYVAKTLTDLTRDTDVVSRYAGDEFVIILPETPKDMAENFMVRIKNHLTENPYDLDKNSIPIDISHGIASTKDKMYKDPSSMLKKADENLYEIKNQKKSSKGSIINFISDTPKN